MSWLPRPRNISLRGEKSLRILGLLFQLDHVAESGCFLLEFFDISSLKEVEDVEPRYSHVLQSRCRTTIRFSIR